ncbi:hypothetical protein R5W23_000560 [Gemmata sp. JC673]|uniref:Protein BatD n=1 Tax=Gemmata algarum TaxID=2975278 RepID=A0ABU5EW90_9BACT|nr:hypothetical protein [Gemmata algarum]MDY3559566.1 hypothetical protein [Gemmata algarum]
MTTRHTATATVALALCWLATGTAHASDAPTVGLPQALDVWLPGAELFAAKVDDRRTPVIVRIDRTTPEREGFRYALVYTGYEPGRFDLRTALRRADGSPLPQAVPPIPVEIRGLRPLGEIRLNGVGDSPEPRLGGYRLALGTVGALWLVGLIGLVTVRRRGPRALAKPAPNTAATLDDRLRTLLTSAAKGSATPAEHAELERAVLVYWVRRLSLRKQDPAVLYATLRDHPEAGPMVTRLEAWLHAPPSDAPVNVSELLTVFRPLLSAPEQEGQL